MAHVRDIIVATRIHLPEASAASFRLDAVEKALVAAGRDIRVLTTKAPGKKPSDNPGTRVSRWPVKRDSSGYVRGYIPYMSYDIPLFFRILFSSRASAILVEPPPTTGFVVRLAAAIRRTPYVWYAADVWSDATKIAGAHPVITRVVTALERFALRGAAAVIAVSDGVAERVRDLGAHSVTVVLNGIDTQTFSTAVPALTAQEREKKGLGERYFLYAGTASEWQGAEVFAQAASLLRKEFPDIQVVFLGQGSSWTRIAEIGQTITEGDPRLPAVVQHPLIPAEEAARWQRGAIASLVSIRPGLGYDFAYPTKVLAALASGTPVLYAGVGPVVDDIETHDLGQAAEYSPEAVAAAMRQLLNAPWDAEQAQRLHSWVVENRSMTATGQKAAEAVLAVAR